MILQNRSAFYAELTPAQNVYPATVMGVMAKFRDLYRQASLNKNYESLYAANRNGLERPGSDRILESFYPVIDQRQPVLFKSEKVLDAQRIFTLKNELNFSLILADVKEGWLITDRVKASGAKVFLALDLPEEVKKDDKKKDDKATSSAEKERLDKRKAETIASYTAQAATFSKAGIAFGFSTMSAKTGNIATNLRRMIAAGLSEDAALAALTTAPAQLLGLGDRLGTVDNGKIANLVISDKPYFNEKAKVRYVFVDGDVYTLEAKEAKKSDGKTAAPGSWSYTVESPQSGSGKIILKDESGKLTGTINSMGRDSDLQDVVLDGNSLTFSYQLDFGSNKMTIKVSATIDGDAMEGTMTAGQMGSFPMKATRDPKN
jgi:hypothetical protein